MSRLTDLIARASELDPKLGAALHKEFRASANKRSFGLVFERHLPDAVELPTRPVRRGDTVHILPPRGSKQTADNTLWTVVKIDRKAQGGPNATVIETKPAPDTEAEVRDGVLVEDLVVVAQHDDVIYPGLVQTGEVVGSKDPEAPFHAVINAENLHALNLLTYTHRHKIDCIYIDPPYNTGAKDWKYNNDYVDGEDAYRHSKWLSMMEKRLEIAKELLNPEDSVLIATIDEKEYLRLGMLLEQTFPGARIQMVSSVINPTGSIRANELARVDEYIFIVMLGACSPSTSVFSEGLSVGAERSKGDLVSWRSMVRAGGGASREESPLKFYPVLVDPVKKSVVGSGDVIPLGESRYDYTPPEGLLAVWPLRRNGSEGRWQVNRDAFAERLSQGTIKCGKFKNGTCTIQYLPEGQALMVKNGQAVLDGVDENGGPEYRIVQDGAGKYHVSTQWRSPSHNASTSGTSMATKLFGKKRFDYPKSLYAVEDALRFFVKDKPNATILDFFSGSGTTAHAVMRLNKQDGGSRRSISVTNNEVGFDEEKKLTKQGLRPGDPEWERLGICDYVTKPRIKAAITGKTASSDFTEPIKGDYKYNDEFPMADGLQTNARFFTLTYEPPTRVRHGLAFAEISPLLWMRAGQVGRVIESIPDRGWDVAESYGVLKNAAAIDSFAEAVAEEETVTTVYVITDDDLVFQSAVSKLNDLDVEFVQLYSTYLTNFAFTQSGGAI